MLKLHVCFIILLVAISRSLVECNTSIDMRYKLLQLASTSGFKSSNTEENALASSEPDYIYNHDVEGWLKLHKIPEQFEEALARCYNEDATLASPLNQHLRNALDEIIKSNMNNSIVLGTQSVLYGSFTSVEGVRLVDMPVTWTTNELNVDRGQCLVMGPNGVVSTTACSQRFPYICYKKRKNDTLLNKCGTFDDEYMYDRRTGSCYKVHLVSKDWIRAQKTCTDEGGYLVIINDAEEAQVVKDFLITFVGLNSTKTAFIGIRVIPNTGYYITVHGDRLVNVYHVAQQHNPLNLYMWDYNRDYGCFNYNYLTISTVCQGESLFVCEKDPKTVRFGLPDD